MNLHIYGQQMQHDDVVLVGDREALCTLAYAIRAALGETPPQGPWPDWFTADGEGYAITVALLPQGDPRWQRLVPPYAEADAPDNALGLLEFLAGEGA